MIQREFQEKGNRKEENKIISTYAKCVRNFYSVLFLFVSCVSTSFRMSAA